MESLPITRTSRAAEKRDERQRQSRIRRLLILLLLLLLLLMGLVFAYLIIYGDLFEQIRRGPLRPLFSVYGFDRPLAVSTDSEGTIYVSDTGHARFLIYDSDGDYVRQIRSTKKADRFYGVIGSYVDKKDGKLYVADFRRRAISVYDLKGKRIARWPDSPLDRKFGSLGFSPFAINMYKGNLYVTSNNGIYVFSKKGKVLKSWTGRGPQLGQWDYPISLAIDKDGTMFVADQLNRRVVAMDQKGVIKWVLGEPDQKGKLKSFFGLPRGLALDKEGRLFVSDTFHHQLVVLTRTGKLVGVVSGRGVEDGKLNFPEGLSFRPDGVLYIADRENDRVQAWRINGIKKPSRAILKEYKTFFKRSKG